ncbi:hypothetical protein GQX73_g1220 [Xylaria multiplex]|uniref:Putative transcription factor kapC n=1 Tax=Xylaria multiplex TaxID=323545 RepID=A0A7C8N3G3_9PEZI|nr:hypothetical protein GQX73_g1220 [Xylaria multiplex]
MSDSLGAGDSKPDSARPSFTGYWKHSKDQQAAKTLTFVSSKLGQAPAQEENNTKPFAEAKAKARRQQVRNAQRQHRQRKANYTKQLEMDITKLRDDIARVEQELEALRSQNGAIKSQLALRDQAAPPIAVDVPPAVVDDAVFTSPLAPGCPISIDIFENLGSPAFHICRASPSSADASSKAASSRATEKLSSATPASTVGTSLEDVAMMEMTLSEEQKDQAINFILALEHCCWNHIDEHCFAHRSHCPPRPRPKQLNCNEPEPEPLNGHALMATSLALTNAPPDVFDRISGLQKQLSSPTSSTAALETGPLAWSTRGLTLTNLRRLAGALNPSDAELAPVQAWFELASLYGVAIATDAAVLEELKRELAGEVKCVVFGAAVRRDVFEAALEKVIGFFPRSRSINEEGVVELSEEEEVEGAVEGTAEVDEEEDGMGVEMGTAGVRISVPPEAG